MKVVVTGGTGLTGGFVVQELIGGGPGRPAHAVTVIARRDAAVPAGVRMVKADIQNLEELLEAFAGADAVVHLAAVPRPGLVPDEVLFQSNVQGTFNVHEAAARLRIRRVVSCTSTAILGWDWGPRDVPPAYLPIDEDHPVWPQDAYGLSKEAVEAIARSFHRKCGMETVVLRPPWIPSLEQMAEVRKNGGRRYEGGFHHYAYVDPRDLAVAFRLAVERPNLGHVVLFTVADDSTSAEPLAEVLPRELPAVGEMAGKLQGWQSAITSARAKAVLGWQPRFSWRDLPLLQG